MLFFDVLAKKKAAWRRLFRNEKGLLHPFGMEHAFLVDAFVGVRAEVVALRLDQVRRQHRGGRHGPGARLGARTPAARGRVTRSSVRGA